MFIKKTNKTLFNKNYNDINKYLLHFIIIYIVHNQN
jgi:hypothetical protein